MTERMTILTIDLEDWFHIPDNDATRTVAQWSAFESRVDEATDMFLGLLATKRVRATFFVLGWMGRAMFRAAYYNMTYFHPRNFDVGQLVVTGLSSVRRLTILSARYFSSPVGGGEVAITTQRGWATFSLGRAPSCELACIGGFERRAWRGLFPLTPIFPTAGKGPLLSVRIMQSPWHVILRGLAAPSRAPIREVQFDGLSMDTF